jgi:SAM-dependent methyltransferase
MTAPADLRKRLRRALAWLQATPLHPQWLARTPGYARERWVAANARGDVLDVGCGRADLGARLPDIRSYVGLDYPTTAIGLYDSRPHVFADAAALPLADASVDTVLLLDVIEHVAEPERALAEAARVLRAGGVALVTVPFAYPLHDEPHDYQRFTRHGLARRCTAAGFATVTIEEAGGAIEAASLTLALALGQAAVEALARPGWRLLLLPVLAPTLLAVNLGGALLGALLPVAGLFPTAYRVRAARA